MLQLRKLLEKYTGRDIGFVIEGERIPRGIVATESQWLLQEIQCDEFSPEENSWSVIPEGA